jgi:hypothetical protein
MQTLYGQAAVSRDHWPTRVNHMWELDATTSPEQPQERGPKTTEPVGSNESAFDGPIR